MSTTTTTTNYTNTTNNNNNNNNNNHSSDDQMYLGSKLKYRTTPHTYQGATRGQPSVPHHKPTPLAREEALH